MKQFSTLVTTIDQSTKTSVRAATLARYFTDSHEDDRVWAIALFSGRRPKRVVTSNSLREWAAEMAKIPLWLFEECYLAVGDLAETIALVMPPADDRKDRSLSFWINALQDLSEVNDTDKKKFVVNAWQSLGNTERFVFNKLISGGFRTDISQKLMTRALSQATGKTAAELAHRLAENWDPAKTSWETLIEAENTSADASRPYPFKTSCALENAPEDLGPPENWRAEWKWDGIRGQLILKSGEYYVWSMGEELVTNRFPELARALNYLPDGTVLDGELLVWHAGSKTPAGFSMLQKRMGRKTAAGKLLTEAPVMLCAYDLLEHEGQDIRAFPFTRRRSLLEKTCADLPPEAPVRLSPLLAIPDWQDLATQRAASRETQAEGVMVKHADSPYLTGHKRGDWWTWKLDPLTIDAVMIYAQPGPGRRANLLSDFTFAVNDGDDLVPFAKARTGLTDTELTEITAWARKNTLRRFGPVRQVTPHHVFEISFEGIQASPRRKSGVALRCPKILRWRKDKPLQNVNTLGDLKELLKFHS